MDPQLCNHIMEDDDNNDDEDDAEKNNTRQRNASVEAAGVVRGVSRSIAKSLAHHSSKALPKQVPKITKQLFTRRGQLRVSGVAKVSDRISTGWEVYSSVKETVKEKDVQATRLRSWVPLLKRMGTLTASEFKLYNFLSFVSSME